MVRWYKDTYLMRSFERRHRKLAALIAEIQEGRLSESRSHAGSGAWTGWTTSSKPAPPTRTPRRRTPLHRGEGPRRRRQRRSVQDPFAKLLLRSRQSLTHTVARSAISMPPSEIRVNHDPIIEEVRAIREQMAAWAGYNIHALCEEARRRPPVDDRPIAKLRPRLLPHRQPINHAAQTPSAAVTIRNPADPSRTWEALFLVDTGATDCVAPRPALEAIGLTPRGQRVYELADGRRLKVDVAVAEIEFMGQIVGATIIYGDPGTEPLLGRTALESVGIAVDPTNQRLKRLPGPASRN